MTILSKEGETIKGGVTTKQLLIAFGFLLQFGLIVWGAARVVASVDNQAQTLASITKSQEGIMQLINAINIQHAQQSIRLDILEKVFDGNKK